jgi:hypothetical protein
MLKINIIKICQWVDKVNYADGEAGWSYIGILLMGFIQGMVINFEWTWDEVDFRTNVVQKREFDVHA